MCVFQTRRLDEFRAQWLEFGRGSNDGRENFGRELQRAEQSRRPVLGIRIVKLRRTGGRKLDAGNSGQKKVEPIGYRHQMVGAFELATLLHAQLEQRALA